MAPRNLVSNPWERCNVAVADCVSFPGYHYHGDSQHPLQKYAMGLSRGHNVRQLRRDFVSYLRHYRPVNAAQALGLPDLNAKLPMWIFPWKRAPAHDFVLRRTWHQRSLQCVDLFTEFSDEGILSYRIEEEWMWSERSYHSLQLYGYKPSRGYLRAHTLHASDGRLAHLLIDGNHRAASLCAHGVERVDILSETRYHIHESQVDKWANVVSGHYSREAALQIFHRYLEGHDCTSTTDSPAPIIAPEGWLEIYC